jgi:hypothetical protein
MALTSFIKKRVDFIKDAKAFKDLNLNPFEIQVFWTQDNGREAGRSALL